MLSHLDQLTQVGDRVSVGEACLEVLALEGHRLSRLRVSPGACEVDPVPESEQDVPPAASSGNELPPEEGK